MSAIIRKAIAKQKKATSVFTRMVESLEKTNEELVDYLNVLASEENDIKEKKLETMDIIKNNHSLIGNVKGMFIDAE